MDLEKYCREFMKRDRLGAHLGIEMGVEHGAIAATMTVAKHHLNGAGSVHGGAIFTLADIAFAAACNSAGQLALAVNTQLTFMKPAAEGTRLVARVRELARSRRLGHYTVEVSTAEGDRIAVFQGTAYVKTEAISPYFAG